MMITINSFKKTYFQLRSCPEFLPTWNLDTPKAWFQPDHTLYGGMEVCCALYYREISSQINWLLFDTLIFLLLNTDQRYFKANWVIQQAKTRATLIIHTLKERVEAFQSNRKGTRTIADFFFQNKEASLE